MFDLIRYWFIYSVVTISGMFWSHTDRQKRQDVDGWFNYSQICINNTVYFNNNNRSYSTSKTLLKYLKTWTSHYLSIIYFAITFYMYIFLGTWLGKKREVKRVCSFHKFHKWTRFYILFILLYMNTCQKVIYRSQIIITK